MAEAKKKVSDPKKTEKKVVKKVEKPEIVEEPSSKEESSDSSMISEPAKVMRIGTMIKQLLEEVKATDLDEPGRDRLKEIYETSVEELSSSLSNDLREELGRLALPFDDAEIPSGPELRIAQAQLVGWLEGLFHGIQATLFAQQNSARHQIEQIQQSQGLPAGSGTSDDDTSAGVYL